MDIEIMERQVRDLKAFKDKFEPMLAEMLPEYEKHLARKAEDEADRPALEEPAQSEAAPQTESAAAPSGEAQEAPAPETGPQSDGG